ncbi:glutathione S-transferase family protein [Candidatus Phycosocius spiralis]|uniref:Glutathione S-transferase n=1 Tax=Candidatus Phycosocius spiralis TaxID=2815099 RepID=A0ABQ4PVE7_9PROT|nr:glutathione S-transferase [Candidatus Phycosocius spiralis]GIU66958.1 glutathione S-transferase [Candidatus Phycosocius spiralis]
MLIVHHLNDSRSQRILWLLEEMGTPYEIKKYQRDRITNLAPPELKAVHPLGKSPIVTDGSEVLAESGMIIDVLARRYGSDLALDVASRLYPAYAHWLHFAEGSAMQPFLLSLYTSRLGEAAAPLQPRIASEIRNHLAYIEGQLAGKSYLVGDHLTGADIQMSFVGEIAKGQGALAQLPNIKHWLEGLHARPQWQKALEKGGPYRFA